jgi:hypothetical protein
MIDALKKRWSESAHKISEFRCVVRVKLINNIIEWALIYRDT